MNKPTNPNVVVPAEFAISGIKTDFSNEKIQSGFDQDAADVLAGDNLNKFIDDTYKSINYSNAGVSDLYKSAVLYDGNETYYTSAIVFNVSGNNVSLYRSLADNNTGNPLTDTTKWQQVPLGADILNLVQPFGMPIPMPNNTLPDGLDSANSSYIWLTGQAVSRTTYANLFSVYGTRFGTGDGSTTFNLPNYNGRYLYCDSNFGYISAGLPNLGLAAASNGAHTHTRGTMNITGKFNTSRFMSQYGTYPSTQKQETGALYLTKYGSTTAVDGSQGANDHNNYALGFDASRNWTGSTSSNGKHTHTITASNSLYGAANTIQTAGVKHKVCTRWR